VTDSTDLAPAELVTGVPALADEDSDELLTINMGPHTPPRTGCCGSWSSSTARW